MAGEQPRPGHCQRDLLLQETLDQEAKAEHVEAP